MTRKLNSHDARSLSRANVTIHDEVSAIARAVIVAADSGLYEIEVDDGTTMTDSTPAITLVGTVSNPTFVAGETLILAGSTVTLGTTGVNLNSAIADINDAAIPGVCATKDSSSRLAIEYTALATAWCLEVGAGTANARFGFLAQTIEIPNPLSVEYHQTNVGTRTDRAKTDEIEQVTTHFSNLGYNIQLLTNGLTNKTPKWKLYW
jgi:hypothetical protein